jgi:predicted nucleic acid-binding protein
VIVVDSSAWIELLRGTGSPVHLTLRRLVDEGAQLAITEVVLMELLAGARGERDAIVVRARFGAFPMLPLFGLADYERAAALFRACRNAGETVRKVSDCLIAVPAIRTGATLLHADRNFEALARHSPLRLEPVAA